MDTHVPGFQSFFRVFAPQQMLDRSAMKALVLKLADVSQVPYHLFNQNLYPSSERQLTLLYLT